MKPEEKKLYELKKEAIEDELGVKEILCQLAEECAELTQAAHKARRAIKGTTPVTLSEAKAMLEEETADVVSCVEMLVDFGMIDVKNVARVQKNKIDRWFARMFGEKEKA